MVTMLPTVKLEKIQTLGYYFLFLVSFTLFVKQNYLCICNYVSDKSTMSTEIVGSDFAEFPAITICPEHKRAFKNEILQQFNLTAKDIRNFIFPSNGMKSQDFYDLITHNLTKLITEMKISMVKPISGTKYTIVKMTDKINAKMSDHRIFTQPGLVTKSYV